MTTFLSVGSSIRLRSKLTSAASDSRCCVSVAGVVVVAVAAVVVVAVANAAAGAVAVAAADVACCKITVVKVRAQEIPPRK